MFHFKMQTVLDVRKTLEDKVCSEFSEYQKDLRHETECLQRIQHQKSELIDSLRNIKDKTVPVSEIHIRSARINQYHLEEAVQQETVQNLKAKVDKKREELLEASKNKKAMEICKTKHFEKFQAGQRVFERTEMDELVIAEQNRRKQK